MVLTVDAETTAMKIVLVHPTGSNWVTGKKDITPVANRMAALGFLSMAAWLEKQQHRVHTRPKYPAIL